MGKGAERKIVQNAIFFRGKRRHDNNILKVKILLSRKFVVMAQAPSFDILIFFLLGEGKGESKVPGGRGVSVFIENPRRGRGRGAGRVPAVNWAILRRRGLNICLRGRTVLQAKEVAIFTPQFSGDSSSKPATKFAVCTLRFKIYVQICSSQTRSF